MRASILLLLASSLLTLAVPLMPGAPSGIDLTVYQDPDCKGKSHKRTNIKYDDIFQDSPAEKSYKLSKDLGPNDYLTFGVARPFVATGDAAKKGCHNLKDPAFVFMFQKSG